ncbi:TspO/MBR-related protein [Macleaya cordata]|uniref:TspO/MBR-related protein n=1 Tax=Macleaya cordata TaxID=56857 RepID=A0A200QWM0_MACCD|nr:TspO/MBR-related protein [Macleaya cordata]
MAMAKRGLRSLAIAISIPVSLTLITIYCSGSSQNYKALPKPFWFPPLWALNFFYVASSFFMGLSSWLVWAEGGFHKQPTALPLCLAQLGLSLAWKPVVFVMGGIRLGLTICVAMFGTLVGCSRIFRDVNPIAGDLVKPCLVWVAFLTIINYKLLYL